jgi:cytochrome c-type biogenesis protein
MEYSAIPVISAVWLGILTSISPCPLASNIAAVSFIMKGIARLPLVLAAGVVYTLGRAVTYAALGFLISASLINMVDAAYFLQTWFPKLIGPILILTGVCLLGVVSVSLPGVPLLERAARRMGERGGLPGAAALGVLFALAFCPVSAALFFGSLIPLTISTTSAITLPLLYGIGTGLPVLVFAAVIAFGIKNISALFNAVRSAEIWVRRATALILLVIGIYYSITHIFSVQLL